MNSPPFDFQKRAREAMLAEHFEPDFPAAALAEARSASAPAPTPAGLKDLRSLLWSSIDNTESATSIKSNGQKPCPATGFVSSWASPTSPPLSPSVRRAMRTPG